MEKNLQERLDGLRNLIQKPDFLYGRGLSNEVNIRLFCYKAEDELIVQHFLEHLRKDDSLPCNIVECDLYKIFLSICEELDILGEIPAMEESDGSIFLLEQIHAAASEEEFIAKIQYEPHERGKDVLLLTGVGNVFPFMRVHNLLEALQPHFSDIPILVMYPGVFNGHQMRLFNRLEPSHYYRAFNII